MTSDQQDGWPCHYKEHWHPTPGDMAQCVEIRAERIDLLDADLSIIMKDLDEFFPSEFEDVAASVQRALEQLR